MSGTLPFNRMPRIQEPLPQGEIRLPAPPAVPSPYRANVLLMLLPLTGLLVMAGLYGALRRDWLLAVPMVAMSGVSLLTSLLGAALQRRALRRAAAAQADAYRQALEQKRGELETARREQQRIRLAVDPDLPALLARARQRDPRLWERRPADADFMCPRLGLGAQLSTVTVHAPHPDLPDPRLAEAQALERDYRLVPHVPLSADLRDGPLALAAPPAERHDLARALLLHLVVHHSPDELHLLAVGETAAEWSWLRWLPHTHALHLAGEAAGRRELLKLLLDELHRRQNRLHNLPPGEPPPAWPWLLLLVDDVAAVRDDPALHLLLSPAGRALSVTALLLVERIAQAPNGCHAVAELQPDGALLYSVAGVGGSTFVCQPDRAGADDAERVARSLAPLRVETLRPQDNLPDSVRLLDVLGIDDLDAWDAAAHWQPHGAARRVTVGLRRGNQPLELDLDASGHGPHGLVAGTTGSGKSELLQTLVVALALAHHPYDLGFVLVDFKGGGAFAALVDLPHTQGLVTDLSGGLAERALVALRAELDRRKRLFSAAGVNEIARYQALTWQGRSGEPLPRLVVIVDEFAELLDEAPDFIDGLIGVARVGRSLGLHLILATQSPAGVVSQQIWANARLRICLRVESRQESMDMLHRPDAADLPRLPGRGYLQVGNNEIFELFQAARVAGCTPSPGAAAAQATAAGAIVRLEPDGRRTVLLDERSEATAPAIACWPSDAERVVRALVRAAGALALRKLPAPWLPPLPDHLALPRLLADLGRGGWDGQGWRGDGGRPWLCAVLGLLDDPAQQRQPALEVELAQQDGHLIVVGAPGAGKGLLARTLVVSLVRAHPPAELHVYLLACEGQALNVLEGLPHVGGLFTSADGERVPRLLRRLLDALDERKQRCAEAGADSLPRLHELQPGAPAAILVVLYGLAEFRAAFPDEVLALTRLVREGGPYGIHCLLLASRPADVPAALSAVVARRLALRLADAADYGLVLGTGVRWAREQRTPVGRGWFGRPALEFQVAAPGQEMDELAQIAELQQLAGQMNRAWTGPRAGRVEALPAVVPLGELLARAALPPAALAVPLGLDALRGQPVWVDLAAGGAGWLVAGTVQSGKTTLLWAWVLALAGRCAPQQVQFALVAGRRDSLGPLEGLPHVRVYSRTAEEFRREGLPWLEGEIERRVGLAASELAVQPRLVVVLDDYDELVNAVGNDPAVQRGLTALGRRGVEVRLSVMASGPLPGLGVGFNDPLVRQLKGGRSGFLLRVLDASEPNVLGVRLRAATGVQPPGRGYWVCGGVEELLQVATPGDGTEVAAWVARCSL